LDEESVNTIWDALMSDSRSIEEKKLCLRWFYTLSIGVNSKGENDLLVDGVMLHIFKKLEHLCLSNPAEVSEIGFECFSRYMCSVNVQATYLKMEKDIISKSSNFLVKNIDDMFGLKCLWQIVLGTASVLVAKEAMEFLVKIYLNIDRAILDINTIQKQYVDSCMTELQQCESLIREENEFKKYYEVKIDRLISLLKMFLEECKKREDKKNEELKKQREEEQKRREEQQKEQEEAQKMNEESTKKEDVPKAGAGASPSAGASKPKSGKEVPSVPKMYDDNITQLVDIFGISKYAAIIAFKQNSFSFVRCIPF